ncbi:hemin uptake protein HemP [Derxia lacustris]|uniref:hemin uptake protein HemP n=1 Tax=Derxia lacustris TaxID=764842 RepID=UPI000A174DC1|nr:hemin uptake protein HemP [Derxia lacustris]
MNDEAIAGASDDLPMLGHGDAGLRPAAGQGPQVWPSQTLLGGQQEARIAHNGELYTLRRTRAGRLILTK